MGTLCLILQQLFSQPLQQSEAISTPRCLALVVRKNLCYLRCTDAAPYINAPSQRALSHCQRRRVHLGVNKMGEGSCPLKCGQIWGMAEKKHLCLVGDQKAKHFPAQAMRCPLVAATGITHLHETPDFLLRITVPVPLRQQSLLLWSPPQHSHSSLARCSSLAAGKSKRENLPRPPPHTEKLSEHATSSFPPEIWSKSGRRLDLLAPLLQPVSSPHRPIWPLWKAQQPHRSKLRNSHAL